MVPDLRDIVIGQAAHMAFGGDFEFPQQCHQIFA